MFEVYNKQLTPRILSRMYALCLEVNDYSCSTTFATSDDGMQALVQLSKLSCLVSLEENFLVLLDKAFSFIILLLAIKLYTVLPLTSKELVTSRFS